MILSVVVVFATLLFALLALAYWISSLLSYPRRQPVTRTPEDLGLAYEAVTFQSADGLALHGWWIPAERASQGSEPGPVALLLHPMFGNRHGFMAQQQAWPRLFRTDVDLLKTAWSFHQAGFTVFMFDFRSHGESQHGLCSGGLAEDQDVVGAVDYVFQRLETSDAQEQSPQVGLVGFGLGATAALIAAGRQKGGGETIRVFTGDSEGGAGWTEIRPPNIKRVRFLVAIQPAALVALIRGYLSRVPAPLRWLLVAAVDWLCQERGAYPLKADLLAKFTGQLNLPVLYVQARPDRWGGCGEVEKLAEATPGPKSIWWIDEPLGRLEAFNYVGDHLETVLAFAREHVAAAHPV
jgi:pimeloyl-ACP methyl ester carboxylesterase